MNEIIKNSIDKIRKKELTSEVVYSFLCAYYDDYIEGLDESEEAPYPEELTLPLEARESGVYEVAYMDMHWPRSERYVNALLQTTRVLLQEGNTGSFFGLCLAADAEKREISLSGPNYLY